MLRQVNFIDNNDNQTAKKSSSWSFLRADSTRQSGCTIRNTVPAILIKFLQCRRTGYRNSRSPDQRIHFLANLFSITRCS
ncbi:unnamed protein product [Chondrus crispus]|uniref:Uncharacterized protein n=1 Tax=Chondrus crispus TaxID=2769 RepID=R7QAG3_CHOCR|nr:unnamed protein product [Chondrus crispus]CDF35034.1 unnamed protein product [Chondrus crispus]|eukprot:XP_005714853.1 unnamed protein product [Chondrus crispus]